MAIFETGPVDKAAYEFFNRHRDDLKNFSVTPFEFITNSKGEYLMNVSFILDTDAIKAIFRTSGPNTDHQEKLLRKIDELRDGVISARFE